MTNCDWWNIKWNTKCGTEDLYSPKWYLKYKFEIKFGLTKIFEL